VGTMATWARHRGATRAAAGVAIVLLAAAGLVTALLDETRALLLGVGTGTLVAAIALGVVLTYRGSGVVNFASGAIAMYSAYAYDALRRGGDVFLPPLPSSVSFGTPLDFLPALLVTLALATVLGLACHLLIFRPLRNAPALTKAIASVGVLIVLQALVVLRFESTTRPVLPTLAKDPVRLPGDIVIASDQLVLLGIVVAVAALLSVVYRFTRFGLATRAAAENERGAVILGFSPDLLAGVNWVLSTVLVALLGVLVATVNGTIDPITITLLIVPALAAALLGGFTSFGVTTAAALAIAMVQNLVLFLSTKSWYPNTSHGPLPGIRESVPLLVIVVALLLRGRALPQRGELAPPRLPAVPRPRGVAPKVAATSALCLVGMLALGPDWRLALTNTLVAIVICLSLVVLTGFVGQISLAQMALAGIAGFTLAKLATSYGVPFPLGPLAGAVAASAVGLLAGIPALRVRGVNLAVVTLAAGVAIENLVFRNPAWSNGSDGAPVPPPRFLGLRFGPNDPGGLSLVGYHGDGKLPDPWFGVFCLAVVVLLALAVVNLRRSPTGRRMLAVRSNERAAAAVGVSVAGTKLLAFGLSAFIAGLGGALSGYRFGSVSPEFFGSLASLSFLAFAYLGGITSVTGAVLGGIIVSGGIWFAALSHWLGIGSDYTLLFGGLGLILTAILNPEGMFGAMRDIGERLVAFARRAPAAATAGGPPESATPAPERGA
jgi:branched-chain amino acid transport system permease protein